jgi:N utilization substance protein A
LKKDQTMTMQNVLETLGISIGNDIQATPDPVVVTGTITSASSDVALVSLPDGREAIMPVSEFFPNRRWVNGETLQMLLMESPGRPVCSVVRPELVEAIYDGVVPELRTGQVRIMSVARAAGVRSKVAVAATSDAPTDPVAAMIGRDANRVNLVRSLLGGERVDIVAWHADPETYLINALAPARVTRVEVTDRGATVHAPSHQMSAAVGYAGLNSQLAGQLLGLPVIVVADTQSA